VFGQHCTQYSDLHLRWFTDCDPEEACDCKEHDCVEAQSTIGHAAAAATTEKTLGIPLIDVVPLTPTPFEIDGHNWHW
jgi:hypothetical protein